MAEAEVAGRWKEAAFSYRRQLSAVAQTRGLTGVVGDDGGKDAGELALGLARVLAAAGEYRRAVSELKEVASNYHGTQFGWTATCNVHGSGVGRRN